jgi:hypothetical protein
MNTLHGIEQRPTHRVRVLFNRTGDWHTAFEFNAAEPGKEKQMQEAVHAMCSLDPMLSFRVVSLSDIHQPTASYSHHSGWAGL